MNDPLFAAFTSSHYKSLRSHIYPRPGYVDPSSKAKVVPLCGCPLTSVPERGLTDISTAVPLNDDSLVHSSVCKNCLRVRERLLQKESQ